MAILVAPKFDVASFYLPYFLRWRYIHTCEIEVKYL